MSTKINTGWLKDKNGEKFAPKTLTSQVQTSDGVLLEDKIGTDLSTLKEEVRAYVDTSNNNKADVNHNHDDFYYQKFEMDEMVNEFSETIEGVHYEIDNHIHWWDHLENKPFYENIENGDEYIISDIINTTMPYNGIALKKGDIYYMSYESYDNIGSWKLYVDSAGETATKYLEVYEVDGNLCLGKEENGNAIYETGIYYDGTTLKIHSSFIRYISPKQIKLTKVNRDIKQLDDKFISDAIARTTYVDEQLATKADKEHNHDDIYCTEAKVNELIDNITNGTVAVKESEHAVSADNATNAIQDGDGNVITETYQTISDDALSTTSKDVVGAINELNEYAKIYSVDWTSYEGDTKDAKLYNALEDLSVNTLGIPSIYDGGVYVSVTRVFSIVLKHEDLVFRIKGSDGVYAQFDPYTPISVMKVSFSTGSDYYLTGFSWNYGYSVLYLYHDGRPASCQRPIEERVKIKQGTSKAGQYLTVDDEGKVTTTVLPSFETTENAQLKFDETKAYADTAASQVKNDLLNGAGEAYDTLKELGDLISDNVDAIQALETVATGKADKEHTHTIADIENLETTLSDAASAIGANTSSINSHSTAISDLQTAVAEIQEITSEEIQALFA